MVLAAPPIVRRPLARIRRLSLLARFAIISFVVLLTLGLALAYSLGRSIERNALAEASQTADESLHNQLLRHLRPSDMARPMTGARYHAFDWFVTDSILSQRTVRVKIWSPRGVVLFSTDPRIVGRRFEVEDDLASALHGTLSSDVSNLSSAENLDDRQFKRLLEVYLPIRFHAHGPVLGAFEIYQRYDPVGNEIAMLQRQEYIMLAGGLILLYLLLFGVVRAGSRTISRQQKQLEAYTAELEQSYQQTISSLAAAVDARDSSTELHAERVTRLAVALGRWIGLPPEELTDLERGALLHDVGKIGVSDTILLKPGALTDEEWAQMRRHPEIGYRMLQHVGFLGKALDVVRFHHERWDGWGYPHGLRREMIPPMARLFAIIDAYDALTSDRPYRRGVSHEAAVARIQAAAGTHFDPDLVAAFVAMSAGGLTGMPHVLERQARPAAAGGN